MKNKNNKFPKSIKQAFIILFLAVCVSFIYNHISGNGLSIVGQWKPSEGVVGALPKTGGIDSSIEINSPETVKKIVEEKQRLILDVRHIEFYKLGHLPGALSFPLTDFKTDIRHLQKTADKDQAILVYCSGFACNASHIFAEKLKKLKYSDVKIYSGGFEQWQKMGYEIEK